MLFLLKKFRFAALLLSLMGVLAGTGWAQDPANPPDPGAPALPPQAPVPSTPPVVDVVTLFGGSLPTAPLSGTFGTTPAAPARYIVSQTITVEPGGYIGGFMLYIDWRTTTTTTVWSDGTITLDSETISAGRIYWQIYLNWPAGGQLASTLVYRQNPGIDTPEPYTIISSAPASTISWPSANPPLPALPGYPTGYTINSTLIQSPSQDGLSYSQTSGDWQVLDPQGNVVFTYGTYGL